MIPDFETLLHQAGLAPRRFQSDLAGLVVAALQPNVPIAMAVQAGTGTGKTWALSYPALRAAAAGRRVVWSTHTLLLRAQVIDTLRDAHKAAGATQVDLPAVAERRGRADYVSPSRTLRLRHALAERRAAPETLELLEALADWSRTLAEFTADHGELPVPSSLVCLTAACPAEEQLAFLAQRETARAAGIVVQTHALTLLEARYGRLDADLVIFDEADTLPSVAAGAVETRLPLAEIVAIAEQHGADITAPLEDLRSRGGAPIVWRDPPMAEAARSIAAALRRAAADSDPDHAEALRDTAEELRNFATEDGPRSGAALVEDPATGPTMAVAAVDPAGWLGAALKDRQVVLMSATLGRHDEGLDELHRACRRLGFHDVHPITVSPAQFGSMSFRLAGRSVPLPMEAGGLPNPRFFDAASEMVKDAAGAGRTLVLCASYGDVEEFAARLAPGVLLHRRGDRLSLLVERFKADPQAVLVTPGAWAGLDLPGMVDNVVILRLPLGRPDALREAVLAAALERRGLSEADARNILAAEARGDAMRRLTQGMGRGVRAPDDRCTVWIADPRFPLPPAMVADLRRGLTQGPARGWEDLAKAIPLRFRQPPGRSPYDRAKLVEPAIAATA